MKRISIFLFFLLLGCGYTPIKKVELETLDKLKSKSIVDVSDIINFSKEDSLIVIDYSTLNSLTELVKEYPRKSEIIYIARDKDRLYLNNLQYRAEQLLAYFISKGSNGKRLKAKIGLDYHLKYSELKNSSIILVIN